MPDLKNLEVLIERFKWWYDDFFCDTTSNDTSICGLKRFALLRLEYKADGFWGWTIRNWLTMTWRLELAFRSPFARTSPLRIFQHKKSPHVGSDPSGLSMKLICISVTSCFHSLCLMWKSSVIKLRRTSFHCIMPDFCFACSSRGFDRVVSNSDIRTLLRSRVFYQCVFFLFRVFRIVCSVGHKGWDLIGF